MITLTLSTRWRTQTPKTSYYFSQKAPQSSGPSPMEGLIEQHLGAKSSGNSFPRSHRPIFLTIIPKSLPLGGPPNQWECAVHGSADLRKPVFARAYLTRTMCTQGPADTYRILLLPASIAVRVPLSVQVRHCVVPENSRHQGAIPSGSCRQLSQALATFTKSCGEQLPESQAAQLFKPLRAYLQRQTSQMPPFINTTDEKCKRRSVLFLFDRHILN